MDSVLNHPIQHLRVAYRTTFYGKPPAATLYCAISEFNLLEECQNVEPA